MKVCKKGEVYHWEWDVPKKKKREEKKKVHIKKLLTREESIKDNTSHLISPQQRGS